MLKRGDKKLIDRVLAIAKKCKGTVSVNFTSPKDVKSYASILMHDKDDLDIALQYIPRMARARYGSGDIWAIGTTEDGIGIHVCHVDKCEVSYEEVEVPEMVATGRMVTETKAVYHCPQDEITA